MSSAIPPRRNILRARSLCQVCRAPIEHRKQALWHTRCLRDFLEIQNRMGTTIADHEGWIAFSGLRAALHAAQRRENPESRGLEGVLIFGSRRWRGLLEIREAFRTWIPVGCRVVHGAARGADSLAAAAARVCDHPVHTYYARWEEHGRKAGPIRNTQMLERERPDFAIGFWDGLWNRSGSGSADMAKKLAKAGVPTIHVLPSEAGAIWEACDGA